MSQLANRELVRNLSPYFVRTKTVESTLRYAHSSIMGLVGLRGYWPMSAVNSSGQALDVSGHGNHLTRNNGLVFDHPYADGAYSMARFVATSSQYLSHVDASDFDILGTESYMHSGTRGLTIGGWVSYDIIDSTSRPFMAKWVSSAGNRSYLLTVSSSNRLVFYISTDGSANVAATHGVDAVADAWYFVVGRFDPSTSIDIFVNGTWTSNTTSIPASIHNSGTAFEIGRWGSTYLDGECLHCFLCAAYVPDSAIFSLYQSTKGAFQDSMGA